MFLTTLRPMVGRGNIGGGSWKGSRRPHERPSSGPTSRCRASTGARGATSISTTRRARRRWPACRRGRGLHAVVQQRAPRQRLQVAARDRGLRGRARGRGRVRRGARRHTWCSCATRPRRSTSWPRRCRRARACSAPRSSTTPTCCRGAATTWRCCRFPAAARSSWSAASTRCGRRDRGSTSSRSPGHRTSRARSGRWPSSPRSRTTTARELFVDAAQLAPHRAIDMAATGIDYLALSGHKLYAPFGSGALVACGRASSAASR